MQEGYWQKLQATTEYSSGVHAGKRAFTKHEHERYTKVCKGATKDHPWERGFIRGWKIAKEQNLVEIQFYPLNA